jgi:drug/metabolite transporter (DMT)-like permease
LPAGVAAALLAAVLFGASTPLAKLLLDDIEPMLLAGLLYAGSGVGLGLCLLWRRLQRRVSEEAPLRGRDWSWLAGAIGIGGVVGPILLMTGLRHTPAATASLLLNLESVFTALIAWTVFHENVDRRIAFGMLLIVIGGALLSLSTGGAMSVSWDSLAIAGACLCWAIDNNFTRAVSGGDPLKIAALKGAVAGTVTITIAIMSGTALPATGYLLGAGVVGFIGYGISLVLFVLALRQVGTARTGAYFSIAPFVGAALSVLFLGEPASSALWFAGGLMALGIWLHVSERHMHEHAHEVLTHDHAHSHDAHHQHAHDPSWDGIEPHTHVHVHAPLVHSHPHFPDLHHRHRH